MKIGILVFSLMFSGTVFAKKDCSDASQYQNVSLTEMQKLASDKSVTIVDVNSKTSFASSRIGNAVHFASAKENFKGVLPQKTTAPIVAYCGGPGCGAWKKAAVAACELGYTNIRHFSEGIKGWKPKNS